MGHMEWVDCRKGYERHYGEQDEGKELAGCPHTVQLRWEDRHEGWQEKDPGATPFCLSAQEHGSKGRRQLRR